MENTLSRKNGFILFLFLLGFVSNVYAENSSMRDPQEDNLQIGITQKLNSEDSNNKNEVSPDQMNKQIIDNSDTQVNLNSVQDIKLENIRPSEDIKDFTLKENKINPETILGKENTDSEKTKEISYDVPIIINKSVENFIDFYQNRMRNRFEVWLTRSGKYLETMKEILKSHDLPSDLAYLPLIESGYNPFAYSKAKAVGMWQFIKGTGTRYGLVVNKWVDERRDPIKSTNAAAKYLKDLFNMFGSWELALASYNAGEGKVYKALVKTDADDFWELTQTKYIRRETKDYVPGFMAATMIAKNPDKYGFYMDYNEPMKYDEITLEKSINLDVIAEASGVVFEDIKMLNPELKINQTPPYEYTLRIPLDAKDQFLNNITRVYGEHDKKSLREGKKDHKPTPLNKSKTKKTNIALQDDTNTITKKIHKVRAGDTLWEVSKRYNVSLNDLKKWNKLNKSNSLRIGKKLVIYQNQES